MNKGPRTSIAVGYVETKLPALEGAERSGGVVGLYTQIPFPGKRAVEEILQPGDVGGVKAQGRRHSVVEHRREGRATVRWRR